MPEHLVEEPLPEKAATKSPPKNPFTKPGRKPVPLLVWFWHNCNGRRHAVGLTLKGQLIFSHHTVRELYTSCLLQEFDGDGNACAALLRAWHDGKETGVKNVLLRRERVVWNTPTTEGVERPEAAVVLAARLFHKRRLRNPAAYLADNDPFLNEKWYSLGGRAAIRCAIVRGLASRGWPTKPWSASDRAGLPKNATYRHPHVSESGQRVTAGFDSSSYGRTTELCRVKANRMDSVVYIIAGSEKSSIYRHAASGWPSRYVCDVVERRLLAAWIRVCNEDGAAATRNRLQATCNQLAHNWQVDVALTDDGAGICSVSLRVETLSVEAALRVAQHFHRLSRQEIEVWRKVSRVRLALNACVGTSLSPRLDVAPFVEMPDITR